ncbi:G-D-S-L family lipolytic protein [Caulobacter sp. Root655]|uniref:rhamnogalacturonan acetylesterase n=1 Tax=Caulobacter sp. Root655 TaxID=1736578 RepID=UPI0006FB5D84|nr:rhamnogalacturonan acetylesterase [Caulobacter sp. Root655]KRA58498.1 G-D-S-L family lipolytic protein [Caulobacter sp. Root655]
MSGLLLSLVAALAIAGAPQAAPAPEPQPVPVPAPMPAPVARILIASDSTAANYGSDKYPQMGWGMVLKCSLDPRVEVVNLARGGRSTKTFIEEGLWDALLAQLKPGDTVLIQFGHNDADRVKIVRFTDPQGAYADNLTRFVADVRAKGGQPVLMTPIAKHLFVDGKVQDAHGPYAEAVRAVAQRTGAPLIDLDADSMAALQVRGEAASRSLYLLYTPQDHIARYPDGISDTTHINEGGARLAAALAAARLGALKLPVSVYVRSIATGDPPILGGPNCPE